MRSPDRCSWSSAHCGCMPPWWQCNWYRRWYIPWGSGSPVCGTAHGHAMMSEMWWTSGPLWRETTRRLSWPESPGPHLETGGSKALQKKTESYETFVSQKHLFWPLKGSFFESMDVGSSSLGNLFRVIWGLSSQPFLQQFSWSHICILITIFQSVLFNSAD